MLNYSNGERWRGSLHSKLWLTSFGFGSHLKKITFIFSCYGSVLLVGKNGGKQNTGQLHQLQPLGLSILRLFNQVYRILFCLMLLLHFCPCKQVSLNINLVKLLSLWSVFTIYIVFCNQFYGQHFYQNTIYMHLYMPT